MKKIWLYFIGLPSLIILALSVVLYFTFGNSDETPETNEDIPDIEIVDNRPGNSDDIVWIDEGQPISIRTGRSTVEKIYGGWQHLQPGENIIRVPNRLGVDLTDPRNEDVKFEIFFEGKGWVTKLPGELVKLPSSKKIRIRVDTPTQVWCHYFYRIKNTNFVKDEYNI